jgi:hypothetical protein
MVAPEVLDFCYDTEIDVMDHMAIIPVPTCGVDAASASFTSA